LRAEERVIEGCAVCPSGAYLGLPMRPVTRLIHTVGLLRKFMTKLPLMSVSLTAKVESINLFACALASCIAAPKVPMPAGSPTELAALLSRRMRTHFAASGGEHSAADERF